MQLLEHERTLIFYPFECARSGWAEKWVLVDSTRKVDSDIEKDWDNDNESSDENLSRTWKRRSFVLV
ncbi:hypothetical protein L596_026934 [Steinernema carpocapsae]|uniref:Uncharacterized protein n=1 Tax=Steinernema carpocapsae TaxID=34508 RepID=A0A4U5M2T8_STECR|nr:hypothetical protein L596_026934 [Steinernema carpocapsae]